MVPDAPDNERKRKIDEAVESGNHELREMARLAYNRGDKELARNIWRTLTDGHSDDAGDTSTKKVDEVSSTSTDEVQGTSTLPDPQLEEARRAEVASEEARQNGTNPIINPTTPGNEIL